MEEDNELRAKSKWIYVLGTYSDPKRAKVGVAANPLTRICNLRTGDPFLYIECAILLPEWFDNSANPLEVVVHAALTSPSTVDLNIKDNSDLLRARKGIASSSCINFSNTSSPSEWFWVTPSAAKDFVIESIRSEIHERSNSHNMLAFLKPECFGCELRSNEVYAYSHADLLGYYNKPKAPESAPQLIEAEQPKVLENTLIGLITNLLFEKESPETLAELKEMADLVMQLEGMFKTKEVPKLTPALENRRTTKPSLHLDQYGTTDLTT